MLIRSRVVHKTCRMAICTMTLAAGTVASVAKAQCGSQWYPVGPGSVFAGTDGPVNALAMLPNGDVIVGGDFDEVGTLTDVHNIAVWHPSSDTWSRFIYGVESGGDGSAVNAIKVLSNGDVVFGGRFSEGLLDGSSTPDVVESWNIIIAHHNGTEWEWQTPGDIDPIFYDPDGFVASLAVLPNGDIVASGAFREAGGVSASSIARAHFNTSLQQWQWFNLSPGVHNSVAYVAARSNGHVVCGYANDFQQPPYANFVANYDFATPTPSWTALGASPNEGTNSSVMSLAFKSSTELYVGGAFTTVAGSSVNADHIAVFDFSTGAWSSLNSGMNGNVLAILPMTDGKVVAAGAFTDGSGTKDYIARYDGSTWTALGGGLGSTGYCLLELPNGDVLVGGAFSTVDATAVNTWNIARWHQNPSCYANCDGSTGTPSLSANDFMCFMTKYALNDPYANCDCSTGQPFLTANDFTCFVTAYSSGCT